MGSKYFTCCHCKRRCLRNIRIKKGQRYCGNRACQQARKNKWEREKLLSEKSYRSKRKASKKAWYDRHRLDRYQHFYRRHHPLYTASNRLSQPVRNERRVSANASCQKIVKTDALNATGLITGGLYMLLPYDDTTAGQKIVKTDALIVELRTCSGFQAFNHRGGP